MTPNSPVRPRPPSSTALAAKQAFLKQLNKLEAMQRWDAEKLRQYQMRRVSTLVEHAYRTTEFYRQRLDTAGYRPGTPLDPDRFSELQIGKSVV